MHPEALDRSGARAKRRRARPPSAHAQARELEIYTTAAEIFHRKGYAATSLQDIADAVGLLKGSLYYYIDGKEDLLYGITRHIHQQANGNLERSRALSGNALDRLDAFIRGHIISFAENLTWVRVFYTEHHSLSGERYEEIIEQRHHYEGFARGLIEEGQRHGLICPGLDPWLVSTGILTMINSVYMWYRPEHRLSMDDVADGYTRFILQGLRCPPGDEHAGRDRD
jgi:TetR/AcrR family transcriptional regulator, cholesterol catabolism regulator